MCHSIVQTTVQQHQQAAVIIIGRARRGSDVSHQTLGSLLSIRMWGRRKATDGPWGRGYRLRLHTSYRWEGKCVVDCFHRSRGSTWPSHKAPCQASMASRGEPAQADGTVVHQQQARLGTWMGRTVWLWW